MCSTKCSSTDIRLPKFVVGITVPGLKNENNHELMRLLTITGFTQRGYDYVTYVAYTRFIWTATMIHNLPGANTRNCVGYGDII